MNLRDEQRQLTRRKVIDAVLDLVAEGTMAELSVPLVSKRSGVSVATIYRHFPTKDVLLGAAAEEPALRATGTDVTGADGEAYLRKLWTDFADRLDLLRHQVVSEAGREMRAQRYDASKAWFADRLAGAGIDPATADGQRLIRVALLLTSSLALLDLHDRQGRSPDEAVDDVTWALSALTAAVAPGSAKTKTRRSTGRSS